MLQLRSIINVADNSGAQELMLIGILGKGNKKVAGIGDIIRCVVLKAKPIGVVAKHEKVLALIIRTKKEKRRKDGSYIRFDDNAAVILENLREGKIKGTRIFGPIAREIKELGYNKIASLAKEIY